MLRNPSLATYNFYIADKLCELASRQETNDASTVRIAQTLDELKAAYRVIYQEYVLRGFCPPDESQMHYNFYCFLPSSRTFILEKKGQVIGTLSLIMDSQYGLPAESAFPDEIGALKLPACRIAEIGLFGLDQTLLRGRDRHLANFRKLAMAFTLFKEMFSYARGASITDFVIAVHPKKESLYRSFTFQKIGSERPYRPACGNPAVAMHMNIDRWFQITPQDQPMKAYFSGESSRDLFQDYFEWDDGVVNELLQEKNISFSP
jgi:hypothetical protein